MGRVKDIKGQQFGSLEPLEYIGGSEWRCLCHNCGSIEIVNSRKLVTGSRTDCKTCRARRISEGTLHDLSGTTIKGITAIEYLGNQVYKCRCNKCGKVYEVTTSAFKNGIEMCRECANLNQQKPDIDLKGKTIGKVSVIKYTGGGLWKCKCSCGKEMDVKTHNLLSAMRDGRQYSCAECSAELRRKDITGQTINGWKVLGYAGNGLYKCQCQCGSIHTVNGKSIRLGESKSCRKCGADKMLITRIERFGDTTTNVSVQRSIEQLNAVSSKANLDEFIKNNFKNKPKAVELSKLLGISECATLRKVHMFNLEDCIEINNGSAIENEIADYIKSVYNGSVILRDRKVLNGLELDIYLPEIKVAIEVNGTYWHSTIFKDSKYHQNKTVDCARKGIHLVHIFEYEWNNTDKQYKIKNYLDLILNNNIQKIWARKTEVKLISNDTAYEFENKYHFQNSSLSEISIGCYYKSKLIGVLSLGKPRFDKSYEYEIIRLCWKDHISVVGGIEKMYSYFLDKFNPESVLTYVNITKFTGNSYLKIRFKADTKNTFTEPSYHWVSVKENKQLSRYQTQKNKLIKMGLGSSDETEDEIMENIGYFKVYDSGNLRLEWHKGNEEGKLE